ITLPSYWGGNFSNAGGHAAMDQIAATGASTVTLIPNFFQANQNSSSVKLNLSDQPCSSESDSFQQVRQAILDAKARGLNVVLKPHLETDNRVWRAEIDPDDPAAWFQSYKAMMVEYAKVAQSAGAAMICVGTEMRSMTAAEYTDEWVDLIAAVRA